MSVSALVGEEHQQGQKPENLIQHPCKNNDYMRVIGIIKEHSLHFTKDMDVIPFNIIGKATYSNGDKARILNYLKNGIPISATMTILKSLINNDSNTIIGSLVYLTDGEWIWPNYLAYYLEKTDLSLNADFLSYIRNKNYLVGEINKDDETKAIEYIKEQIVNK